MFKHLISKVIGSPSQRVIKKLQPIIQNINHLESEVVKLSDAELRGMTDKFKDRIEAKQTLDDIMPEAFAVVREAARRVLSMRPFDVQMIGGAVLHSGAIAEMRTGEGKTLMSTLPAYLNALLGKGVHMVTLNEYLARRDAEWMGRIYNFLGQTVACLGSDMNDFEKKKAYQADITYGTNNEFGFDYLRDNMKYSLDEMVQSRNGTQGFFAVIDEVDSVLIDESRTPLVISGRSEQSNTLYEVVDLVTKNLSLDDFEVDEKMRSVVLTDKGHEHLEELLAKASLMDADSSLYSIENMRMLPRVNQALRAHKLYKKDVDYMLKDDQVVIIDEFTGRTLEGRRYSDGLHQAIEAKEGVQIQSENQTIASTTFQNYFRGYEKLAGMTGTASTEEREFFEIYKLRVVAIPPNLQPQRIDYDDIVYRTAEEKYDAILDKIIAANQKKQPVLVGTASIEKSEFLSSKLKKKKIKHNVLNAKFHAIEAEIIAQAGQPGAITIATNMAGRGTDIMLGGNAAMLIRDDMSDDEAQAIREQVETDRTKVKESGGLMVVGTERNENRRADNQLRGRAGRQGDPGCTYFFLSLEDDLMRLFGSETLSTVLPKMGLQKGQAIIHPFVSKSLERAQSKIEARNYEIRKNLLQFDDVMNEQRKIIYHKRIEAMKDPNIIRSNISNAAHLLNKKLVNRLIPQNSSKDQWDITNLERELHRIYVTDMRLDELLNGLENDIKPDEIVSAFDKLWEEILLEKTSVAGNLFEVQLKQIFLGNLDFLWKEHLHSLDHLRSGINLRSYAQKNPLNEYKLEAFNLFKQMFVELDDLVVCAISHLRYSVPQPKKNISLNSRNSICYCGSGKKYKYCHGILN